MSKMAKAGLAPVEEVSVAAAKNRLSELLGRVAYGGASVLITRHGKPMARLVPAHTADEGPGLEDVVGWLDDAHPFLSGVDEIIASRARHLPRVLRRPRRR